MDLCSVSAIPQGGDGVWAAGAGDEPFKCMRCGQLPTHGNSKKWKRRLGDTVK